MWRAAAWHLSRRKVVQAKVLGCGRNSTYLSKVCGSASSTSATGQAFDRAIDKETSIDSHWHLQSSPNSSLASSLTPAAAAVRTHLDETLDAALHNVVNLPWLFWHGFQNPDGGYPNSKQRDRPSLDHNCRFASAAEAVIDYEIEQELEIEIEAPLAKYRKGSAKVESRRDRKKRKELSEFRRNRKKQKELYKRQLKIETEAWQEAAVEYKELMLEMCRKNLAPNLPFAQSLLLDWFEPLRNAIEQELNDFHKREFREHRSVYGPFITQLPADMLAVITMHRLMGLLMNDQEHGCVKVLQAALQIGETVEQEVGIYKLMRRKKNKKACKAKKDKVEGTKPADPSAEILVDEKAEAILPVDHSAEILVDAKAEAILQAELQSKLVRNKVKKLVKHHKLKLLGSILKQASSDEPWGPSIQAKVGTRLLELMLETSFVRPPADQSAHDLTELRPAFKHTSKSYPMKSKLNRIYGVIECDPLVMAEVDKSVRHMVMPYMPMLVKPKRWNGFYDGGYLHLKSSIMRTHGAKEQRDTLIETPREKLTNIVQYEHKKHLASYLVGGDESQRTLQVVLDTLQEPSLAGGVLPDITGYLVASPLIVPFKTLRQFSEALDALGETRWKINTDVLDILERVWEEGGRLADLVDCDNLPLPVKPTSDDVDGFRSWRRAIYTAKRINNERHCMRCDTELKLVVARKLREEEQFFYPHNLDFRGRAYPMHPHLNHLGSDMCRGILQFADGRPLGSNGLRWLKIHLANLYGGKVGKMSFDSRVAWVDEMMEEIYDSAEKPLDGSRWWLQAEDPFQLLATSIDVRNAIMSGNPETYVSALPVHQDGSCNGLQHYAALGRDRNGAGSVNLIAGEKPADVYTGIAARVRDIMEKDAKKDPAVDKSVASAKILLPEIDRKLVKQTVMTSVYGVTFIGARMQIFNRLKERGTILDEADMHRAACYAAKTTLDALGEMFKEARCIMTWLGNCAKIIASSGDVVKWTTPLGLPVVQPYRKAGRHLVKTSLQILALRTLDATQPVLVQRQRSAFPPNFVHSLDSSHMMMTALACQREGLTFAGVHDSYWTHAGDVEQLNLLLRQEFVNLYSQPILENLLKSFQEQFPHLNFPDVPARGDFDLKEVLEAPYFFN